MTPTSDPSSHHPAALSSAHRLRVPTVLCLTVLFLVTTAPTWAAERTWTQTYSLGADGQVSLSNVNGDVEIVGSSGTEVVVDATIRGPEASLDDVEILVDATESEIEIETQYLDEGRGWGDNASVEYRIQLPSGTDLDEISLVNGSLSLTGVSGDVEVSLVNGSFTARGLGGDVEVESVNGGVELHIERLGSDQQIDVESVNGSIDVYLPAGADALVSAETVHGRIRNDFGFEVESEGWVGHEMTGTLGAGGGSVELENVNGSIEIHRAE